MCFGERMMARWRQMHSHRELSQSAWPAEWNPVVMFSLRGEKEGERRKARGGGGTGLELCMQKACEESEEGTGWGRRRVGHRGVTRRGREERMKGPTGMEHRRRPAPACQSVVSPWHLNLCWPGRDCLSGTGDITGRGDLWPITSSSPPHSLLGHLYLLPCLHFSSFTFLLLTAVYYPKVTFDKFVYF